MSSKKVPKIRTVTPKEKPPKRSGKALPGGNKNKPLKADPDCICEPVQCTCMCVYDEPIPPCSCVGNPAPLPPCPHDGCSTDTCLCQGYCPNIYPGKAAGKEPPACDEDLPCIDICSCEAYKGCKCEAVSVPCPCQCVKQGPSDTVQNMAGKKGSKAFQKGKGKPRTFFKVAGPQNRRGRRGKR